MPKDPRNEREAQPHLQAAADRKYLKYERHLVKPSYRDSDWRSILAAVADYVGLALAGGALLFFLYHAAKELSK